MNGGGRYVQVGKGDRGADDPNKNWARLAVMNEGRMVRWTWRRQLTRTGISKIDDYLNFC